MPTSNEAEIGLPERPDLRLNIFAFYMHPIIYGKSIRGGERLFLGLSKRFRQMGMDVWALEGAPCLKRCGVDVPYGSLEIARGFRSLPPSIRDLLIGLYVVPIVLRHHKRFPFDLIYLHVGGLANALPAYIVSRILRKPLVITFTGPVDEDSKYGFMKLVRSRMGENFSLPLAVFRSLLDLLRWFIYRRAEACLAISKAVAEVVGRRYNIDPLHLYVTGAGVDIAPTDYVDNGASKEYDAAYCGSLESSKGIETLLHAWKAVTASLPSARLLLIGGGTGSADLRYRNMVRDLDLEGNVVFAGHVPSDEVSGLLAKSKVFVFPSRSEGLGLVILEAMSCGLPCVVSDIPAIRENFDGIAVLVDPNDAKGFTTALIDLLSDEEKRRMVGLKSKEHAKNFSWDEAARRNVQVFVELLQAKKR